MDKLPAESFHGIEFSGTIEWTSTRVPEVESQATLPAADETSSAVDREGKKAVTVGLRVSVKKRAETAVLRTAPYKGGYLSLSALVDGAIERELDRLAIEFNDGEPFPQNGGDFRQGRPVGR
ncbi:hypothetical protein [Conyzicola sp.]|uniref:hypothetical protein n=1 Tax=Conyzicola sp. TaxID=1969404 RepID=UPI003989D356